MRSGAVRRSRRRVPVDDGLAAAPRPRSPGAARSGSMRGASATAWLIGAGLEALDAERRQQRDRRLERLSRSRPAPRRGRRLRRSPRPRRGRTAPSGRRCSTGCRSRTASWRVYEGGLFEDAPAHAIALLVRPPTIWSLDEAIAAERLFPRGSALRARAVRRDRAPCVRADPRRAPDSAPSGRRPDRGPVAGGRAPGCERDHRLGLRARRGRRRPRASGRRPPARAIRLERARRDVRSRIRRVDGGQLLLL